jgi:hypothetical protein
MPSYSGAFVYAAAEGAAAQQGPCRLDMDDESLTLILPTLRWLRSSFRGRALRTSFQAWQQQVERILSGA